MKTKNINNGATLTIEKPASAKQTKEALASLKLRDDKLAAEEKAAKDKAKVNKAKHKESAQAKKSAADKAKEKADNAAAREAKRAEKAKEEAAAKLGDSLSKAAAKVARHTQADSDADGPAVRNAIATRIALITKVLGTSEPDGHHLTRVSGRGITCVPFKQGIEILAYQRGLRPDANGNYPADGFAKARATYNKVNTAFNAFMAKVEAEKSSKFSLRASPKVKKGTRSATVIKSSKIDMAKLSRKGGEALVMWEAIMDVCDASERLLNVGAARLVNNPVAFARAGDNGLGKCGRHLSQLRSNSRLGRPNYASDKTLAEIEKKGDDKLSAKEFHPLLLADAIAFNLKNATKPKSKDPVG